MGRKNLLVVVVGPTAVGKTSVTIELAEHFGGEIISADSRQFYREMEIGTAKPDESEMARVPHHLINSHSIDQNYDAGSFADDADLLLEGLFQRNPVQFMVGGSGLYIKAFCEGFDEMPEVDPATRELLNEQWRNEGLAGLLEELKKMDPAYYEIVDKNNPQRVIRGLEITRTTGQPFSMFRKGTSVRIHNFDIIKIGLNLDRADLYERIDQRMDQMIAQGLFEEAQKLYPFREKNALQTVGYKEIFDCIDGAYDREEAVRLLKRNSRRYAKRQLTWFRKDPEVQWFAPDQLKEIIEKIGTEIA